MDGLLPTLTDGATDATCGTCADCLAACPGLDPGTPESELRLFGRRRQPSERWLGIYDYVAAAWATDEEMFKASASGGGTTTLLKAAQECLDLDCLVVAGREAERPWRAASAACFDPAELPNHAQSTYQLFPHLSILKELFRANPSYRVGIVGVACHVQALRKLQRLDSRWGELVRNQVKFIIEIACSSNTTPQGTETLITELVRVPLESVTRIRFRDGDYPGQVVVGLKGGENRTLPFWQLVRHFKDYKVHRCLSCGDWLSGLADISVCDGDPNIFQSSVESESSYDKHGTILVRTGTGAEVVEWARRKNLIETRPTTIRSMNLGMERKRNRRRAYEDRDVPIPEGPIPGYREEFEVIPDEAFLAVKDEGGEGDA